MMIKRIFDIIFAMILLSITFPLLLIISFLIYINISRKIFFIQRRPGYMGKPFNLIKFKSMNDKKNIKGDLLSDTERLSKFGGFLRSTSLDELPSLLNIINGQMSFIGPRPLLMEYLRSYNENEFRRHHVLPGLSGWAQVNGRNLISWERKFELDLWYVDNRNFLLDLKIILMTIFMVIRRKGIKTKEGGIMPSFKR